MVVRRKTRKGICCAPGRALPSARAATRFCASLAKCAYDKNATEAFRRKRTNASRDVGRPRVHSGCRSPLFPIPRRRPRRFRTSFRGRSAFSFPVVQRTAARFARSVATRRRLHAAFFFFASSRCASSASFFHEASFYSARRARARVLVKASARARPQRTTRRFRRTSGRRRRSPRRPTEPPAPGASVSARLLAARRFARVRVGSRVGKRAS
jgi:hypothetical protein